MNDSRFTKLGNDRMKDKLERIKKVISAACKTCDRGFTKDVECEDSECPIGKIWDVMEES